MDYWKSLLLYQRRIGRSGLSIPFIIGSQRFLEKISNIQDIKHLILDVMVNDSFVTTLRYCTDIKALILEIKKSQTPVYFPTFNGQSQMNFTVSTGIKSLGETVEQILDELISMYQIRIENEQYSALVNDDSRDSIWSNYSDKDIQFIRSAFDGF